MIKHGYFKMAKCKKCRKEFLPAPMHVYKHGKELYCSWSCFNHRNDEPKEEIAYEGDKT